jgi:hypothetical protein
VILEILSAILRHAQASMRAKHVEAQGYAACKYVGENRRYDSRILVSAFSSLFSREGTFNVISSP